MDTDCTGAAPTLGSADLAAYRLLSSAEAAAVLAVPVATLRTWRSRRRGYGPPAVHLGGSIRYRPEDLLSWIRAHTETVDDEPTVEQPRGAQARADGNRPTREAPIARRRRPTSVSHRYPERPYPRPAG